MTLRIDLSRCSGCALCLESCPFGALALDEGVARVDALACTLCGACVPVCTEEAITMEETRAVADKGSGVLVFAEQRGGVLAPVSLELLGIGRRLADDLGTTLHALLITETPDDLPTTLYVHGADVVHVAAAPGLGDYRTEPYTSVTTQVVLELAPEIVLMGATARGRDLAPRVAQRLGTGLTADCTELSIDPKERLLLQTRPTFGGNIMATIITPERRPQMATVREGVMERLLADPSRTKDPVTVSLPVELQGIETFCEIVTEARRAVTIDRARILVAGGRGVGSAEGFTLLGELAEVLGGELAGSRVAVEKGWIGRERQVGQTGSSVAPDLYIACGISGSVQHRAGIKGARVVAAINTDPEAPIFHRANFGIVGDFREVIPLIIRTLKRGRKDA